MEKAVVEVFLDGFDDVDVLEVFSVGLVDFAEDFVVDRDADSDCGVEGIGGAVNGGA